MKGIKVKRILGILFLIFVVYVVGINVSWHIEDSKLSYPKDMQELSYSYLPNFSIKRTYPKIVEVDDKLFFIGGDSFGNVDTIEVYNKNVKKMHLVSDRAPVNLGSVAVFRFSENKLLIFSKDGIAEFNCDTEKFTLKRKFKFASFDYIDVLPNGNYVIFGADYPCYDKQKPYLRQDLLYNFRNNELSTLRNFEFKISEGYHCSEAFPYSLNIYKTADNKILFKFNKSKYSKILNESNVIESFAEIFDKNTLKFTALNYYNYNLDFDKFLFFDNRKLIYNPVKHSYEVSKLNIEAMKNLDINESSLKSQERYYILDNGRVIFFIPSVLIANDTSKSLAYISVYEYNFQTKKTINLGYLPYYAEKFSIYQLSSNELLLSGGETNDYSDEQNPVRLEQENIILHLK